MEPPAALSPSLALRLPDAGATDRLGRWLAGRLRPGDLVALSGPVGAGKSHLARAAIQALLAAEGRAEEVPSPSFTLVQTYDTAQGPLLHADLYRLTDPRDLDDIGLTDAVGQAICLVEWPELLALPPALPQLEIALAIPSPHRPDAAPGPASASASAPADPAAALAATTDAGRQARLTAIGARWRAELRALSGAFEPMPPDA